MRQTEPQNQAQRANSIITSQNVSKSSTSQSPYDSHGTGEDFLGIPMGLGGDSSGLRIAIKLGGD